MQNALNYDQVNHFYASILIFQDVASYDLQFARLTRVKSRHVCTHTQPTVLEDERKADLSDGYFECRKKNLLNKTVKHSWCTRSLINVTN